LASKDSNKMIPESLQPRLLDIPADLITTRQVPVQEQGGDLKLQSSSMSCTVFVVAVVDPFVSGDTIFRRVARAGAETECVVMPRPGR